MAQEVRAPVLVIDQDTEGAQHRADRQDDLLAFPVLDQAVFDIHDPVGPRLVASGEDIALFIPGKDVMDLVAVTERILHADDRLQGAEASEELFHHLLFIP